MKFTTNYSKRDHNLLFTRWLIRIVIVGLPLFLFFFILFPPLLDELMIWVEFLVSDADILKQFLEKSLESIDLETINKTDANLKLFSIMYFVLYGLVFAPIVAIVAPGFFVVYYFPSIAEWIIVKSKTNAVMKFTIFKDGKPCFQKKVKKI